MISRKQLQAPVKKGRPTLGAALSKADCTNLTSWKIRSRSHAHANERLERCVSGFEALLLWLDAHAQGDNQ